MSQNSIMVIKPYRWEGNTPESFLDEKLNHDSSFSLSVFKFRL